MGLKELEYRETPPPTYLVQPTGEEIRMNLSIDQIEDMHSRGATIKTKRGGTLLIRL